MISRLRWGLIVGTAGAAYARSGLDSSVPSLARVLMVRRAALPTGVSPHVFADEQVGAQRRLACDLGDRAGLDTGEEDADEPMKHSKSRYSPGPTKPRSVIWRRMCAWRNPVNTMPFHRTVATMRERAPLCGQRARALRSRHGGRTGRAMASNRDNPARAQQVTHEVDPVPRIVARIRWGIG